MSSDVLDVLRTAITSTVKLPSDCSCAIPTAGNPGAVFEFLPYSVAELQRADGEDLLFAAANTKADQQAGGLHRDGVTPVKYDGPQEDVVGTAACQTCGKPDDIVVVVVLDFALVG